VVRRSSCSQGGTCRRMGLMPAPIAPSMVFRGRSPWRCGRSRRGGSSSCGRRGRGRGRRGISRRMAGSRHAEGKDGKLPCPSTSRGLPNRVTNSALQHVMSFARVIAGLVSSDAGCGGWVTLVAGLAKNPARGWRGEPQWFFQYSTRFSNAAAQLFGLHYSTLAPPPLRRPVGLHEEAREAVR
jgi:hypothetical protein